MSRKSPEGHCQNDTQFQPACDFLTWLVIRGKYSVHVRSHPKPMQPLVFFFFAEKYRCQNSWSTTPWFIFSSRSLLEHNFVKKMAREKRWWAQVSQETICTIIAWVRDGASGDGQLVILIWIALRTVRNGDKKTAVCSSRHWNHIQVTDRTDRHRMPVSNAGLLECTRSLRSAAMPRLMPRQ